jgi:predicted small lipoprotein YifL
MTELRRSFLSIALLSTLAACGGSSNPLTNPSAVSNPETDQGNQHLAFAYFQKCIDPILVTPLQIPGSSTTNTCAGAGCHDTVTGAGGALRIVPGAQPVDIADPANTPAVIRATDMYKNFYSAQGMVIIGNTAQSRIVVKPLVLNVFHGGGLIFSSESDPNVKLIKYWITHPAPLGQDEFSPATYTMFTPADPKTGTCNTQ